MGRDIILKKIESEEMVEGKVIVFCYDRGWSFAIEERSIDAENRYIHKMIDRFEVNSNKKIKSYQKAFKEELVKHLSCNTKEVYLSKDVAQFLEKF